MRKACFSSVVLSTVFAIAPVSVQAGFFSLPTSGQLIPKVSDIPAKIIAPAPANPQPAAAANAKVDHLPDGSSHAQCSGFEKCAHQQQKDLWCWAASVQMISEYNGVKVTQAQVVERVKSRGSDASGQLPEEGAIKWEVMNALCPGVMINHSRDKLIRSAGTPIAKLLEHRKNVMDVKLDPMKLAQAGGSFFKFDEQDLVSSISGGKPVLLSMIRPDDASASHMVVVYDVTFTAKHGFLNGAPSYVVSKIKVEDPWTGKPAEISVFDLEKRVDYMMSEASVKKSLEQMGDCWAVK